jgi:hypothetical protein
MCDETERAVENAQCALENAQRALENAQRADDDAQRADDDAQRLLANATGIYSSMAKEVTWAKSRKAVDAFARTNATELDQARPC